MYRFVRWKISDIPDWEDVVQEVFCSTLLSLNEGYFKGHCSLKTWVYRIMLRRISDCHRGCFRLAESLFFEGFDCPSNNVSAEDIYEEKDLQEKISRGFVGFTPRTRQVFYLLLYGWSIQEIAEVLSISYNTVDNHVKRGRRKIKRFYRELEEV